MGMGKDLREHLVREIGYRRDMLEHHQCELEKAERMLEYLNKLEGKKSGSGSESS